MNNYAKKVGFGFGLLFAVLTARNIFIENKTSAHWQGIPISVGLAVFSVVIGNKIQHDADRISNLQKINQKKDSELDAYYEAKSLLENENAELKSKIRYAENQSVRVQKTRLDEFRDATAKAQQEENEQRKILNKLIAEAENMKNIS